MGSLAIGGSSSLCCDVEAPDGNFTSDVESGATDGAADSGPVPSDAPVSPGTDPRRTLEADVHGANFVGAAVGAVVGGLLGAAVTRRLDGVAVGVVVGGVAGYGMGEEFGYAGVGCVTGGAVGVAVLSRFGVPGIVGGGVAGCAAGARIGFILDTKAVNESGVPASIAPASAAGRLE